EEIEFYDTFSGCSSIYETWLGSYHGTNIHNKFNIKVNKYTVKTISLNSILRMVDKIDVLKIDIEGAEYLIFKNLDENLFKKKVRLIVMELHNLDGKWTSAKQLLQYLEKLGFKLTRPVKFAENAPCITVSLENALANPSLEARSSS
ncbi:MAG: FkbM family methyltransferase, partial [bacterium]|nr:FkbM family methyltransferase [bacterium]